MLICAGMKLISGRISLLQQLLEKSVGVGGGRGRAGEVQPLTKFTLQSQERQHKSKTPSPKVWFPCPIEVLPQAAKPVWINARMPKVYVSFWQSNCCGKKVLAREVGLTKLLPLLLLPSFLHHLPPLRGPLLWLQPAHGKISSNPDPGE